MALRVKVGKLINYFNKLREGLFPTQPAKLIEQGDYKLLENGDFKLLE